MAEGRLMIVEDDVDISNMLRIYFQSQEYDVTVAERGEDALEAAVLRLGSGPAPRRRDTRERFLSRSEVDAMISEGPADLSPQRLRGAFHWHTTDSDGKATLETMAHT